METEKIIRHVNFLIEQNNENIIYNSYDEGHRDGYNDALVDLLNTLDIKHNYEYYNGVSELNQILSRRNKNENIE